MVSAAAAGAAGAAAGVALSSVAALDAEAGAGGVLGAAAGTGRREPLTAGHAEARPLGVLGAAGRTASGRWHRSQTIRSVRYSGARPAPPARRLSTCLTSAPPCCSRSACSPPSESPPAVVAAGAARTPSRSSTRPSTATRRSTAGTSTSASRSTPRAETRRQPRGQPQRALPGRPGRRGSELDLTADVKVNAGPGLLRQRGPDLDGRQGVRGFQDTDYEVPAEFYQQFASFIRAGAAAEPAERPEQEPPRLARHQSLNWLTDLSNEGDSDVEGTNTIHITGHADVAKLVADLKTVAQKVPQASSQVTPAQIAQFDQIGERSSRRTSTSTPARTMTSCASSTPRSRSTRPAPRAPRTRSTRVLGQVRRRQRGADDRGADQLGAAEQPAEPVRGRPEPARRARQRGSARPTPRVPPGQPPPAPAGAPPRRPTWTASATLGARPRSKCGPCSAVAGDRHTCA